MTIKFSELNPIITPAANDIFALTDLSEGTSKHVTFSDLKSSIIDANLFLDDADDIITALNGSPSASNDLRSTFLWGGSAYQEGTYYLEYSNFANTPTIPADISDLTNSTGFLTFDQSTTPDRVVYAPTSGSVIPITTSFIAEGTNLYYTDARVEDFLDVNFETYFNQFSTSFEEASTSDSYFNISGTFQSISGSGEEMQSNIIRIANTTISDSYVAGQPLRVFGTFLPDGDNPNLATAKLTSVSSTMSVDVVNFPSGAETFSYRIAEFDLETGEISPANSPQSVSIGIPGGDPSPNIYAVFNQTYFLRVNFTGLTAGRGVLVYRSAPVDGGSYKLIAVLGPKDVGSNSWIDYYNEDFNSWTGKASDNSYSDIVHFPLTPPSAAARGWSDTSIANVDVQSSYIDVTLSDTLFINSDAICTVAHDDTSVIQSAIDNNNAVGIKSLTLNAKDYVITDLTIPDNFGLQGTANITKLIRMPFGNLTTNPNQIRSSTTNGATSISFVALDIDGNAINQYLFADSTILDANYALTFGENPVDVLIDKVRILNPIGGGIYARNHSSFKMVGSEIKDSGLSDRLPNLYSPMVLTGGTNLLVSASRFENFTDNVDVSITDKGSVTGNIINNCGSGLFTYGSRFLSTESNVLIGPTNEFISAADTLNSEFDSVNITLQNAYLANAAYTSSNYKYQENGLNYDLTANAAASAINQGGSDGDVAVVYYDTFFIQENAAGVEEIYDSNTGITLNPRSGLDKSLGEFGFSIDANTVGEIVESSGTYSYSTLVANNALHKAIVYSISFEHEVEAGSIVSANTNANTENYSFTVSDLEYVAEGSRVKLNSSHTGSDVPDAIGTVVSVSEVGGNSLVTVNYAGANVTTSGTGGALNIIDKFVMAKGRIL